jgi:hypothetical protein
VEFGELVDKTYVKEQNPLHRRFEIPPPDSGIAFSRDGFPCQVVSWNLFWEITIAEVASIPANRPTQRPQTVTGSSCARARISGKDFHPKLQLMIAAEE